MTIENLKYLSKTQVDFFNENGYLIIPNFLTQEEANKLKTASHDIIDSFDLSEHKNIFGCSEDQGDQTKQGNDYFLNSWNNVSYFFEEKALDKEKNIIVDKHRSINKVGHALHDKNQVFGDVTYHTNIQAIAHDLEFISPAITQSMVIYKQPRIGGSVTPHQDASFLWTTPKCKLIGFWLALENCTKENGCLWFVPGSHKKGLIHSRLFIRNPDKSANDKLIFSGPPPGLPESSFIPGEVPIGTLVLIDGYVVHQSYENKSEKSREIYTWHVIETVDSDTGEEVRWSPDNWIQPDSSQGISAFSKLYTNLE